MQLLSAAAAESSAPLACRARLAIGLIRTARGELRTDDLRNLSRSCLASHAMRKKLANKGRKYNRYNDNCGDPILQLHDLPLVGVRNSALPRGTGIVRPVQLYRYDTPRFYVLGRFVQRAGRIVVCGILGERRALRHAFAIRFRQRKLPATGTSRTPGVRYHGLAPVACHKASFRKSAAIVALACSIMSTSCGHSVSTAAHAHSCIAGSARCIAICVSRSAWRSAAVKVMFMG